MRSNFQQGTEAATRCSRECALPQPWSQTLVMQAQTTTFPWHGEELGPELVNFFVATAIHSKKFCGGPYQWPPPIFVHIGSSSINRHYDCDCYSDSIAVVMMMMTFCPVFVIATLVN